MKLRNVILANVLSAIMCIAPAFQAQTVETPIRPVLTGGGLLAGKVLPSGVQAWLGVPFAAPPVGDLRWQAPRPMSWKGVWNADRIMPECIQVLRPHNINHYFGEEPTSENCLYLNIWAPANATAGAKLPVIVFLYGGGFTIGSSGMAVYGGEQIAKRGAIFVNLNYRVGVLGYMAHPELTKEQGGHSGNYGFLDQNAGLKWVHANIEKFGGDPSQVVLMGQSAGAYSVSQQVFSPLSKGLFRAAVMSSGCNWDTKTATLASGESTGLQLQKMLGAANLAEMRLAPADKVLSLQAEFQVGVNNPGVRTGPVIDGYFMPKEKIEIMAAHEDNDVPIIASSNGDDIDAAMSALTATKTVVEYKDVAQKMYGENAAEFLKLYPVTQDSDVNATAHRAVQDAGLQGSSRGCSIMKSQHDKTAAYIDFFVRKHAYAPGVKIADQDPLTVGAYHTADIPYWFGTLDAFNSIRTTRAWTASDRELSNDMMDSLIAFAKTGSPATPAVPWQAWTPTNEVRIVFGDHVAVEKFDVGRLDWLRAHPAKPVARPNPAPRKSPID